jgi:hypothetical protein
MRIHQRKKKRYLTRGCRLVGEVDSCKLIHHHHLFFFLICLLGVWTEFGGNVQTAFMRDIEAESEPEGISRLLLLREVKGDREPGFLTLDVMF